MDTFEEQCFGNYTEVALRGCFIHMCKREYSLLGASLGLEIIIYCGFAVEQFSVVSAL